MSKIYDITISMHENMPAYPGDEKVFSIENLMDVTQGDAYSIKRIQTLTHTGTHIDVPAHYLPGGKTLDQIDLSHFIGPADVYEINNHKKITLEELSGYNIEKDIIVLFKTVNSCLLNEGKPFSKDYVYLTPEVARFLANKSVKAVGIDYLSIDGYEIYDQPVAHYELLGKNIPIIEGINLFNIPAGRYKFTGLPLKIPGADGSPIRAILEEI